MPRVLFICLLASLALATTVPVYAMYSPIEGRFIDRDPGPVDGGKAGDVNVLPSGRLVVRGPRAGRGYQDGTNLYAAYFVPGRMDPMGLSVIIGGSDADKNRILSAIKELCPDISMNSDGTLKYTGTLTDKDCLCIGKGLIPTGDVGKDKEKLCCCLRELINSKLEIDIGLLGGTGSYTSPRAEEEPLTHPGANGKPGTGAGSRVFLGDPGTTLLPLSKKSYTSTIPASIAHEVCGHALSNLRGTSPVDPVGRGPEGGFPYTDPAYPRGSDGKPVLIPPWEQPAMDAENTGREATGQPTASSYY